VKIAAGIAALYLIIVVLMALAQDRLLLRDGQWGAGWRCRQRPSGSD
jgi:hypothetical protein